MENTKTFGLVFSAIIVLSFVGLVVGTEKSHEKSLEEKARTQLRYPVPTDKVLFEKISCQGVSEENIRKCQTEKRLKLESIQDEDYQMVKQISYRCGGDPLDLSRYLMENERFGKYLMPRFAAQLGCQKDDKQCQKTAEFAALDSARSAALLSDRAVAVMFKNNADAFQILSEAGCFGEREQQIARAKNPDL